MDLIEDQVAEALRRIADTRPADAVAAWRELKDRMRLPQKHGRPRWALAVAAAAVLAMALLAGQVMIGKGALPQSAAAELLRQAAMAAAANRAAAGPDQFVHLHFDGVESTGAVTAERTVTYLQPQVRDTWLSVDGSRPGAYRVVYGSPTFLKPGDEQLLASAGAAPTRTSTVEDGVIPALGQPTPGAGPSRSSADAAASAAAAQTAYRTIQQLPTDPGGLLRRMTAPGTDQRDRSERTLGNIADTLFYSTARPALRAALFEAAARVPGVTVAADPTAADGSLRAVAVSGTGVRRTVVFDIRTGEVVRERLVVTDETAFRGAPAGTAVQDVTVTATVVNDAGGS